MSLCRPAVAALALAVALPASAGAAPRLHVDRRCYAVGDPVRIRGSGFPPNSAVGFTLLGRPYGSSVVDARGRIRAEPGLAPPIRRSSQRVTLTANSAAGKARTRFRITRLSVSIAPRLVAAPTDEVTFRARGFDPGRTLYVHYVTPRGNVLEPRRLGRLHGPCGTRTARAPLIPQASPPAGRWRLRFDTSRRYTKRTRPQVRLTVRVR
jgi:hypothetical protein